MQTEKNYQSYLLRLWHENDDISWRASLQDIASQEQFFFPTLEALFMFLCTKTRTNLEGIWESSQPAQKGEAK